MKIIQQRGVTERRSNFVITLIKNPLLEGYSYYLIIFRHSFFFFHFKGNSHFKVMFEMRWKYAYNKKIYA